MRYYAPLLVVCVSNSVFADLNTNSSDGINSIVTGLNGSGVLIGEVDIGRSGKAMYDSPSKSATNTIPNGVYFRTDGGFDIPDSEHITNHATVIAGIMIGNAGVATSALLHSAAVGANADDVDVALTMNRLARLR